MAASARRLTTTIPFGYGAEAALRHGEPEWLASKRAAARAALAAGLPSPRVESWKYTNLQAFAAQTFERASDGPIETPLALLEQTRIDRPSHRLVFVNGRFAPALSDLGAVSPGVTLRALDDAISSGDAVLARRFGALADSSSNIIAALNTAHGGGGVVLALPRGAVLAQPVHLVFVATDAARTTAFHPRVLVEAGEGSSLTLIESHVGEAGAYWSNPVAEIALARDATVRHWTLQNHSHDATHLALNAVSLAQGARYESVLLAIGAGLARHEFDVAIEGERAEVSLDGAYLIGGAQHSDHTTRILHKVGHASTREVYKGVLDGKARGVFQGTIVVEQGADKTDAHQLSRTLMLSAGAEVDAKPELMIYADDVKCSHGASSGALDPAQLFYLRSRGIGEAAARALLVEGFVAETIERIADDQVRAYFARASSAWLGEHGGALS